MVPILKRDWSPGRGQDVGATHSRDHIIKEMSVAEFLALAETRNPRVLAKSTT